jgi:MFS family permease
MFMDIGSEMIHSLLPVYLVTVLAASTTSVGLIEGLAETTASVVKVFSGAISDYLGKRKLLAALGYGLGAVSKPIFPLAPNLLWVSAARFIDRVGKGIRGAPRDALVADIAPLEIRGACYGLRQTLDSIGAFAGPGLAMLFMALSSNNYHLVFWIAFIPSSLAVLTLIFGVQEPDAVRSRRSARFPISVPELRRLGGAYWGLLFVAVVLNLGRFSEAFLLLRAQGLGLAPALTPIILVVMNVVYSLISYPVGRLSDRIGRVGLLVGGYLVFVLSQLTLALAGNLWYVGIGTMLWGIHLGMTQGLLATMVAESVPGELRGTAFGVFNLLTGLALLPSSVLAGYLWDIRGAAATFGVGAVFALLALGRLLWWRSVHGEGQKTA